MFIIYTACAVLTLVSAGTLMFVDNTIPSSEFYAVFLTAATVLFVFAARRTFKQRRRRQ